MTVTWNKVTNDMGNTQIIKTDEDGTIWYVPEDLANSDYQAYLESLEA